MSNAAAKMRNIGDIIMTEVIPNVAFVLVVCDTENQGFSNYVSNIANKDQIIVALEELLEKMKQAKAGTLPPKEEKHE